MPGRDAVNRTAAIHGRVPLVCRDLVVDERSVRTPVPQSNDQVALFALRAWWTLGSLSGGDAVGPVGKHVEGTLTAEATHRRAH